MTEAEHLATIRYATADELPTVLPGADVLFLWESLAHVHHLASAWPTADSLRWIHTSTAGVDRLLFPALTESDIHVTNSRGVFDRPIAEYVLAALLILAKDLHTTLRLQDRKQWRHRDTERIEGKHALVVGTGPIGRAIATQLSAAGLTVAGAGRTARDHDPDFGTIHASHDLPRLVGGYDYVILAAPLTDDTHGMINADTLTRFRPTARLINIGRGALIVEDDLINALRAGHIAGAALDVFTTEPLPETSPLWDMPNVLISPHMSGDTLGWHEDLVRLFTDNLRRYTRHQTLENVVDKQRGYVSGTERP
jgi:phosphoglycerate dehydrogenase-like enzyme